MIKLLKCLAAAIVVVVIASVSYAQFSPPPPNININGHTYTSAQWQANPLGTMAAIANDIGAITALYPTGRFSPRVILLADLQMYVSPSGNDANNCLVSNPCQTIQRPIDLVKNGYDLAGHRFVINLADGSYTTSVQINGQFVGQTPLSVEILGNTSSPSSVTIACSSGAPAAIYAVSGAEVVILGLKVVDGSCASHNGIASFFSAIITYAKVEFGAFSGFGAHVRAFQTGMVFDYGNNVISGGAWAHYTVDQMGSIYVYPPTGVAIVGGVGGTTDTLTGSPGFISFAFASRNSLLYVDGTTRVYSGTGTGTRFVVEQNATIFVGGAGASYFPLNTAGSPITGGQYN